jgi:hypothetical protein
MPSVKIHVHPRPAHNDYDHHVPFYGVVYNKDTYQQDVQQLVPTPDTEIILTSNGEPEQRLQLAFNMLKLHFDHVTINNQPACYDNDDGVFLDQTFVNLPKASKNFQAIVDHYLATYQTMPFVQHGDPTAFRGYNKKNKQIWFQYGRDMPGVDNSAYKILNQLLEPVFLDLIQCLKKTFCSAFDVENNLLLRLNHSQPNSGTDFDQRFFLLPHLDTSIVTAWVWTSNPGAMIYQDSAGNGCVDVQQLYDQNHQYCIIPGLDYCDFSSSMKNATWHGVQNQNLNQHQHRVGIVAFLKQP